MHEMSLCEGILQILEEQAKQQHFTQVKAVHLEVGVLAGVELSSLEFSYDIVMKDSLAQGSRLILHEKSASAWCMQCMQTVEIKKHGEACPCCQSFQLQINTGEEFRITELEVV